MRLQSLKDRFQGWFPGHVTVHDRWGNPVGPYTNHHEYRGDINDPAGSLTQMRWTLGLM